MEEFVAAQRMSECMCGLNSIPSEHSLHDTIVIGNTCCMQPKDTA